VEIFIGSSAENLDLVRHIELWLAERDHQAVPWDQPGLFPPGEQTMRVLIDLSRRVEAAILIFGADDKVWYRGDSVLQPRDNVIFEYGLFAGALGPHRAIVCRNGDARHPGDLAGITTIDLSPPRRDRGKIELSIWARKLSTRAPIDPALLRLQAQVAVLADEKEQLARRLDFEADKSRDLSELLGQAKIADFSRYDLGTDGHWKLLFDYTYFYDVAREIADAAEDPVRLRLLLDHAGAGELTELVAWHSPTDPTHATPERNPYRNELLTRKVLRLFRRSARQADAYADFILNLPPALRAAIDSAGRKVAGQLRTT
jgi:hypothetical protein